MKNGNKTSHIEVILWQCEPFLFLACFFYIIWIFLRSLAEVLSVPAEPRRVNHQEPQMLRILVSWLVPGWTYRWCWSLEPMMWSKILSNKVMTWASGIYAIYERIIKFLVYIFCLYLILIKKTILPFWRNLNYFTNKKI